MQNCTRPLFLLSRPPFFKVTICFISKTCIKSLKKGREKRYACVYLEKNVDGRLEVGLNEPMLWYGFIACLGGCCVVKEGLRGIHPREYLMLYQQY